MLHQRRGFNLVELMIVVAIIGILAAIALPQFLRMQRKSRQSEAKGSLAMYHTAIKASAAEIGCFRGNFVALNYQLEGELFYRVTTVDNPNCNLPTNWPSSINDVGCVTTNSTCSTATYVRSWNERVGSAVDGSQSVAVVNNSYTARAASNLGGNANDEWIIDQNKTMLNTTSGL